MVVLKAVQAPTGGTVTLTGDVQARYGLFGPGQRVFFRVYRQNIEGRRSAPASVILDVP